jgi:molybdopterin-binding protein
MKTSARNELKSKVVEIKKGAINKYRALHCILNV